jgi:hypothetical protein
MLEGADSKVHFVHYTPEMEEARSRGELRVNSFVRLRNIFANGVAISDVEDLGNAERLLSNRCYLTDAASKLLNRGIVPTEDGWGGWLGRYQAALASAAAEMSQRTEEMLLRKHERKRQRDRSLGR